MSKAAQLAALIGSGQAQGNQNIIFNGAMQVQQRGTVTGITGTAYGSCDRFKLQMTNAGTWTASQDASAPSGFTTSNKLDCTTADASLAAADFMFYAQHVEAQNLQNLKWGTSSAKSLTLSFWVKSNKTGVYSTEIQHGDMGSGNYWNNNTYTISSANTWEYKTIPITGETSTAINNDNGIGLYVRWWLASGTDYSSGTQAANTWQGTAANRVKNGQVNLADNTSNEWLITGVQLEVGDVATPFEHVDFGTTLAKCQRYFTTYMDVGGFSMYADGYITATLANTFALPCTMRISPTVALVGTWAISNLTGQPTINSNNPNIINIYQDVSGSGRAYLYAATGDGFTADAEL